MLARAKPLFYKIKGAILELLSRSKIATYIGFSMNVRHLKTGATVGMSGGGCLLRANHSIHHSIHHARHQLLGFIHLPGGGLWQRQSSKYMKKSAHSMEYLIKTLEIKGMEFFAIKLKVTLTLGN